MPNSAHSSGDASTDGGVAQEFMAPFNEIMQILDDWRTRIDTLRVQVDLAKLDLHDEATQQLELARTDRGNLSRPRTYATPTGTLPVRPKRCASESTRFSTTSMTRSTRCRPSSHEADRLITEAAEKCLTYFAEGSTAP